MNPVILSQVGPATASTSDGRHRAVRMPGRLARTPDEVAVGDLRRSLRRSRVRAGPGPAVAQRLRNDVRRPGTHGVQRARRATDGLPGAQPPLDSDGLRRTDPDDETCDRLAGCYRSRAAGLESGEQATEVRQAHPPVGSSNRI